VFLGASLIDFFFLFVTITTAMNNLQDAEGKMQNTQHDVDWSLNMSEHVTAAIPVYYMLCSIAWK